MLNFEVNGLDWTVVFVPWNDPNLYRDNDTLTVGMCDSKARMVYISDYIEGEFLRKVILHELVHVFVFSFGLNKIKLDCEERMADLIATHGADILATAEKIWEAL